MILLYRILSNLFYPILVIFIYLRKIFKKEDPLRFKEKIYVSYFNINRKEDKKLIWFHAASIGEFKSIIPLIEHLNTNSKDLTFLITTTTLSSGNLAVNVLKKFRNIEHRFFPLDVSYLIKKFILLWKPDKIFLVDSEIWPNLILFSKKYEIPIALINARLSKKSFNRWKKFPKTAKEIFNSFGLCLSSNLETKKYLEELNAKNIFYHGNIKLINKINPKNIENINKHILLKKRFWIASSTHENEENFCFRVHAEIKKIYKDVLTIIAPRHIDRSLKIKSLSEKLNYNTQLLNEGEMILADKEIIIINSFGVLQEYFKYSKSVFIGKSINKKLKNDSGQNPIDAARLGCKVYHGPYINNFREIYSLLEKNNISKKVETYEDLSKNLIIDLESPLKKNINSVKVIEMLGQKTLSDTMKNVNNFVFNNDN